jgi:NADH-quinone oxidoreductase subunit E
VTTADLDTLIDDLQAGRLEAEIPPHGTLGRNRQHIPADRVAGNAAPDVPVGPVWMPAPAEVTK